MIGRKRELSELMRAYESEYSEFVAVTGRRRVGKTFLVREAFNYKFTFYHSGIANQKTRVQLQEFYKSLVRQGLKKSAVPTNWFEAFSLLANLISASKEKKKVLFIDELPWMDAPRSNFVSALEHFWNSYASARKDVLLIICGSATSWIINKVFRNHGGLHNRVTYRINLCPFTLHECEQYAKSLRLEMSRRDILECYMVMGGVPFYWSLLERGKSVAQNIDDLFFSPSGKLHFEYRDLYHSLFKNPEPYLKIVSTLGAKRSGLTREEIATYGKMHNNAFMTRCLDDLEACGFIHKYSIKGVKRNSAIYQLKDNYSLFYYKFLNNKPEVDSQYWSVNTNTPVRNTWQGLAFERVCFAHVGQIKQRLGISGVMSSVYSWRVGEDPVYGEGAQIDMIIDRADGVLNFCEMKYCTSEYVITKMDDEAFRHRSNRFVTSQKVKKSSHWILIAPNGIKKNMYQYSVQSVIDIDALFLE